MKKKESLESHHKGIVNKITEMLTSIDDLREDPLFIDNIHGEQELSLDQTIELLNGIRSQFEPAPNAPNISAAFERASYDASWSCSFAPLIMPREDFMYTDSDLYKEMLDHEVKSSIAKGDNFLASAIGARAFDHDDEDNFLIDF